MRADRQTEMEKLVGAFLQLLIANLSNNMTCLIQRNNTGLHFGRPPYPGADNFVVTICFLYCLRTPYLWSLLNVYYICTQKSYKEISRCVPASKIWQRRDDCASKPPLNYSLLM